MKHATLIIGVFCGLMAPKPTKFDTWSVDQEIPPPAVVSSATLPRTSPMFSSISGFRLPLHLEDCLSVNIWTKPQVGERKKAVVGFPALSRNYMSTRWSRLGAAVGCGTDTSNATDPKLVTDCMRNRTSEKIFGAFGPEETAAEAGYLIDDNTNEAGLFRSMQPNKSDAYWNDFNSRYYTCGTAIRISQTADDGMLAWRCRHFGDFPNLAISANPPSGAYHGAELPPLFGTLP
ncbi:carboxylesterase [Colletotrichum costaricense]|uniref:Carboxylesterase n=1 Tax=Colletotrichum costaricense TaxID=1209916 RepID=A0AAI9Z4F0_9PEZI|nr:carboxylesterase [Colletotrichum costaricense]KAK1534461.1 carboxylesterase [Colletotrichum costaricense]